jgi:hypothetical protein
MAVKKEWVNYAPYFFVAAVVFEFMHIADELAGNWAPFGPIHNPTVAAFMVGAFTLVAMCSLWWILPRQPWGYGLAALFGLFFLIAEMWHYVDPAHMTPFRWSIVILAQASAAIVVILSVQGLRMSKSQQ